MPFAFRSISCIRREPLERFTLHKKSRSCLFYAAENTLHCNTNTSRMSQSRVLYPNNYRNRSVIDSNVGAIYPGAKAEQPQRSTTRMNRFSPHKETQEMDPTSSGALQFLPAYSRSNNNNNNKHTSVTTTTNNTTVEASWDALLDNQNEEKKVESDTNLVSSLTARAQQTKQRRPTPQRRKSGAPSEMSNGAQPANGKGRIARLAMLFGNHTSNNSRGAPTTMEENRATSPTNSSSSGYIGWPGTQDARGHVKSYDESSTEHPSEAGVSDVVKPKEPTVSVARTYTMSDAGPWKMAPSQIAPRNIIKKDKASPVSSTTSSAYMNENDLLPFSSSSFDPHPKHSLFANVPAHDNHGTAFPDSLKQPVNNHTRIQPSPIQPIAPTKELLEANDRLVPPQRTFPGYPGLIDKAHEVPCLADGMDSDTSSRATSAYSTALRRTTAGSDVESDIFDGVTGADNFDINTESPFFRKHYPTSIAEDVEETNDFSMVSLGGGLTVIQTSAEGFFNRKTASDYDDQLTNSECDQHGYAHIPSFHEMVAKGRKATDSSLHGIQGNFNSTPKTITPSRSTAEISRFSSDEESSLFTNPYQDEMDYLGDLSDYYIDPNYTKKLVRRYRRLSQQFEENVSLGELEKADDENKAFALFEMRSRIMEKDIERGLERRGGTAVVDDIVTTPYYRKGLRVRDACIVSKAWRDGVVPTDIRNAAVLTRRSESTYYIRRTVANRRYTWEAVNWVDDTDFMQYWCPSLGGRHMRGFEMFTIGDCQSILLKLTNEQCEVCLGVPYSLL